MIKNSVTELEDLLKPYNSSEILGNIEAILEIKDYLKTHKERQLLLLKGPSGVGKSSAAALLLKESGYHVITIALSEIQTAKSVENIIQSCINSRGSILNWGSPTKFAILIDELECLPIYMKNLLNMILNIHSSKSPSRDLPIIFVCSKEYHRTIEDISRAATLIHFKEPTLEEQYIWCDTVITLTDRKVTASMIRFIIKRSGNDIRQLSNNMIALLTEQQRGKSMTHIRQLLRENSLKESKDHLFTLLHNSVSKNNTMHQSVLNYNAESILLPWMIFENIYRYINNKSHKLRVIISELIVDCDLLWEYAHGSQAYEIEKYYASISCWGVPLMYQKYISQYQNSSKPKLSFPSIMIKRSQRKLNQNYVTILNEKQLHNNDYIVYGGLMVCGSGEDEIVKNAQLAGFDFDTIDKLNKLGNSYYTRWTGNIRKKIKKLMTEQLFKL